MIEINLLPEELKAKAKAKKPAAQTASAAVRAIDARIIINILISIGSILFLLHAGIFIISAKDKTRLSRLESQWEEKRQLKTEVDAFNREHSLSQEDAAQLLNLLRQRLTWSDKLNKLSLYLPAGVWFNEVSVSPRDFSLYGATVSLQKDELGLINKFIDALKDDPAFFRDFIKLELSSVQKKTIGGYDITEFVLQGALKAR